MFNFLKSKPKQPNARQWLMESICYFREMGFYQDVNELSDEEFALWWWRQRAKKMGEEESESKAVTMAHVVALFDEELKQIYERMKRRIQPWECEPSISEADCLLLGYDTNRIWWEDLEQEIFPGDDTYKRVFQEWSDISRGVFLPIHIEEIWEAEEGPMQIEILLAGERDRLVPRRYEQETEYEEAEYNEWIDLELLHQINQILARTDVLQYKGTRYEIHLAFDQTGYVLALTPAEKTKLMLERSWKFVDFAEG